MPKTYDQDDMRGELEEEIAALDDILEAERIAHKKTLESLQWYKSRLELLQQVQKRMRDPERVLVCDILANGTLLPDPDGKRYGQRGGGDLPPFPFMWCRRCCRMTLHADKVCQICFEPDCSEE